MGDGPPELGHTHANFLAKRQCFFCRVNKRKPEKYFTMLPSSPETLLRVVRRAGVRSRTARFLLALRWHDDDGGTNSRTRLLSALTNASVTWLERVQEIRHDPRRAVDGQDDVDELLRAMRTHDWFHTDAPPLPLPKRMTQAILHPRSNPFLSQDEIAGDAGIIGSLQGIAAVEELAFASRLWRAGVGAAGHEAELCLWKLSGTQELFLATGAAREAADIADAAGDLKRLGDARHDVEGFDWCPWKTNAFAAYVENEPSPPPPQVRRTQSHWSARTAPPEDEPPVVVTRWGVTIALLRLLATYPPRDLAFAQRLLALTWHYPRDLFVGVEDLPKLSRSAQDAYYRALRAEADRRTDPLSCANLWRLHSLRPTDEDETKLERQRKLRAPLRSPTQAEVDAVQRLVAHGATSEPRPFEFLGYTFQVTGSSAKPVEGKEQRVAKLGFNLAARNNAWTREPGLPDCVSFVLERRELPREPGGPSVWIATTSAGLDLNATDTCGHVVRKCDGEIRFPKLTGTRMLQLHDAINRAAGAKWAVLQDVSTVPSCDGLEKSLQLWHLLTKGTTWYGSHGYLPLASEQVGLAEVERLRSYPDPRDVRDFRGRVTDVKRTQAAEAAEELAERVANLMASDAGVPAAQRAKFGTTRAWADHVVAEVLASEGGRKKERCLAALDELAQLQDLFDLPTEYWIKFYD